MYIKGIICERRGKRRGTWQTLRFFEKIHDTCDTRTNILRPYQEYLMRGA